MAKLPNFANRKCSISTRNATNSDIQKAIGEVADASSFTFHQHLFGGNFRITLLIRSPSRDRRTRWIFEHSMLSRTTIHKPIIHPIKYHYLPIKTNIIVLHISTYVVILTKPFEDDRFYKVYVSWMQIYRTIKDDRRKENEKGIVRGRAHASLPPRGAWAGRHGGGRPRADSAGWRFWHRSPRCRGWSPSGGWSSAACR